ncbi:MAG: electron transfer flavoprotein subunit beta/FixA family protein [Chloroflexota bacterium]
MQIAVLVKHTPDTAELPGIAVADVASGDINANAGINPWDEFAVEEAIDLASRFSGDSTAITMGKSDAEDALRHALAMGVKGAAMVACDNAHELDLWTAADLLAGAVKSQGDVDVVLAGKQSVDGNSGVLFVGVAQKLGMPLLVNVSKIVDIADGTITVERIVGNNQEVLTAPTPVVISVAKEINEPRYPSIIGIRKAKRVKIASMTAADLGVDTSSGATSWTNLRKPEARNAAVQFMEGDSLEEKAVKLVDALMAEKVI